jgi:hypothetical protein
MTKSSELSLFVIRHSSLPRGANVIAAGGRKCHAPIVNDRSAWLLRENTGTSGLEQTARAAAAVLAHFDIPHLIVGGLAVQEHGYPRVTLDVDIVVPDILEAVEFLTADVTGPFFRIAGCEDRVEDRRTGVKIDLLPGGKVLKRGSKVRFPEPEAVSDKPQFISLEELISLKMDSWSGSPLKRHRDKSDVIELIQRRNLPRNFPVASAVRRLYEETWDGLKAET